MSESLAPFVMLGQELKRVRERMRQSIPEVSGAVEVSVEDMQHYEAGTERPDEEVLILLCNHFGLTSPESIKLWQLGLYEGELPEEFEPDFEVEVTNGTQARPVVLLAMDTRAVYSDGLIIEQNGAGLTLNFTQNTGPNGQQAVARVGMSYEQAIAVMKTLQKAILNAKLGGGDSRKMLDK